MELLIAAMALGWSAYTSVYLSKKKAELHNDPVWQLKNTWREREKEIAEQESVEFWSKRIEQQGKLLEESIDVRRNEPRPPSMLNGKGWQTKEHSGPSREDEQFYFGGSIGETIRWNPKPTSKPSRPRKGHARSTPPENPGKAAPLNIPKELEFTKGTKLVLKDKAERMNTKVKTGILVCPKCFSKGMAHYPGCENYDWFCHNCCEQYYDYNSYEVVRDEEESIRGAHLNHVADILDMTMNQKRATLGLNDGSNSKDELLHDLIHYIKSREVIYGVYADNEAITYSVEYELDNEELKAYVDLYFDNQR